MCLSSLCSLQSFIPSEVETSTHPPADVWTQVKKTNTKWNEPRARIQATNRKGDSLWYTSNFMIYVCRTLFHSRTSTHPFLHFIATKNNCHVGLPEEEVNNTASNEPLLLHCDFLDWAIEVYWKPVFVIWNWYEPMFPGISLAQCDVNSTNSYRRWWNWFIMTKTCQNLT